MGIVNSYKNSGIYQISIRYGKEKVKFNLARELKFSQDFINKDLQKQPIKYGFCLLIHKKLLTEFERLKSRRKQVFGELLFKAKAQKLNGRPLSDDLSKAWVEKHPRYLEATRKCIETKDWADQIFGCIKAFEQRKDLMQTISSNIRQEQSS